MKRSLIICALLTGIAATAWPQATAIRITVLAPKNRGAVDQRHYVSGTVSDPNAEVWVVIHPMEVSEYWVQPAVVVKDDGSWRVLAYFGRAGLDFGKEFEIRAFANPATPLKEGMMSQWPKAAARSDVVEVLRK